MATPTTSFAADHQTEEDHLLGHVLTVTQVVRETEHSVSVSFDVPEALTDKFQYKAGQFLTIRIPSDLTGHIARCYSLSSAPGVDPALTVAVKRTRDGYGSNWINDNAKPGLSLRVMAPAGTFVPTQSGRDLVLFSGGSGVTPIISIAKWTLANTEQKVSMFYANTDPDSIIFNNQLQELTRQYPDRFVLTHWLDSQNGRVDAAAISAFVQANKEAEVFVCGPGPFMELVKATLHDADWPRERLHIEEYVSLHTDPFQAPDEPSEDEGPDSQVTVKLDGQEHQLNWAANANLVDIMLRKGLNVPYSCREGDCGSCIARLRTGTVDMAVTDALEPEDMADGYILACQAHPTSQELSVEF